MTTNPSLKSKLQESPFMTVAEVASYMRVSKMTIYRLVHSGELPAIRIVRSFRINVNAVDNYMKRMNQS